MKIMENKNQEIKKKINEKRVELDRMLNDLVNWLDREKEEIIRKKKELDDLLKALF